MSQAQVMMYLGCFPKLSHGPQEQAGKVGGMSVKENIEDSLSAYGNNSLCPIVVCIVGLWRGLGNIIAGCSLTFQGRCGNTLTLVTPILHVRKLRHR